MAHFYFRARQNNSRVQLVAQQLAPTVNLECSTDETNWSIWYKDSTLSSGQTLYLRGDNPDGFSLNSSYDSPSYNYGVNTFQISGAVEVGGDIRSLVDVTMASTIVPALNCFTYLFYNCSAIVNVDSGLLSGFTTLTEKCYKAMFYGCSGLTTAPVLPATTLADYCYYYMFNGCTSLTTAPELPATTLTENCYNGMFYRCSNLTSAPALPATTVIAGCYYYMFKGCTSLETAPILPATTLADTCYSYMFSGCTNLNYIKCLATDISAYYCTNGWVSNVASTGTFVKSPLMSDWTTGNSGIPAGWTVIDEGLPSMSANPTTFSAIPYSGGVVDSSIAYVNMDISTVSATTSESWLHWEWLDIFTKEDIEITIDSNPANSGRTGTVTITGRDIDSGLHSQTITVTQDARPRGSMSADTTSIEFDYSGGDVFVEMAYNHINGATVSATTEADWLDLDWRDQEGHPHYELKVECDENTGFTQRTATILISGPDEYGNQLSFTISVEQVVEDIYPIWKDIYYSGSSSTLDYYITMDGNDVIYHGRAYVQPGKENVEINISKICQNYLSNDIEDGNIIIDPISFVSYSDDAVRTFQLYNASGDTLLKEYTYLYDWSYNELPASNIITHPINGHADSRMVKVATEINLTDGQYINHSINGLYNNNYCGDYALYYQQRNGGWAAFLVEGSSKKTDTYEKYAYNMAFNNRKAMFEKNTYHNQIVTSWELHTGWLTDSQADNLAFNLLASNRVFLHSLKDNKIIPIVLTNSTAEYKTFKNNSKRLINYTITAEESQRKQLI